VYRNGKIASECTVSIARHFGGSRESIGYSGEITTHGGFNHLLSVGSDDQKLYLELSFTGGFSKPSDKLTEQGAAEFLWAKLIEPLQQARR
jgi:hypothetical protein